MSLFAPRADLLVTFSAEEQARVRSLLAQNHVDYRLKVVDRSAPSHLSTGRRGRTGSFGESPPWPASTSLPCARRTFLSPKLFFPPTLADNKH